jgi:predicted ferric reductase
MKWRVNFVTLAAGLGFGAVVGTSLVTLLPGVSSSGGMANALGSTCAMTGTYLCLMLMVLISRVAWIEKEAGHDRMIQWHRSIAPYSLFLIVGHVVFTTIGYAQSSNVGVLHQLWLLITTYGWMLPATVGFALMVILGLASHRIARRRMKYETWWTAHLYFYIAIALSFGHQITTSQLFLAHPLLKKFWIGLYVFIGLLILVSRIAVPLWLSLRSGLKVSKVVRETDNVVSIYVTGRNLKRFNASGGQFFQWRFITPHWWWQAHPYSLSMKPINNEMRITVKHLGDQSSSFQELLKPGTRVIAEGPYGVFTAKQRYTNAVTAFAAGIGVTPIRAMMDDLPKSVNITFIYRVSDGEHAPLRQELDAFAERKGWEVVYLEGPREQHPMTVEYMSQYAPALLHSDIYICGPNGFMDGVIKMVTDAGVPEKRIHHESFAF